MLKKEKKVQKGKIVKVQHKVEIWHSIQQSDSPFFFFCQILQSLAGDLGSCLKFSLFTGPMLRCVE